MRTVSCSCGTGFRKDAHDRGQDPEADPDVSCKSEEILVIITKYAAVEMKNPLFSAMKGLALLSPSEHFMEFIMGF